MTSKYLGRDVEPVGNRQKIAADDDGDVEDDADAEEAA